MLIGKSPIPEHYFYVHSLSTQKGDFTMATAKKVEKTSQKSKPAKRKGMKLVKKDDTQAVRIKLISEAAYFRAEKRNFEHGDTVQDWLEAESEIDQLINSKQVK